MSDPRDPIIDYRNPRSEQLDLRSVSVRRDAIMEAWAIRGAVGGPLVMGGLGAVAGLFGLLAPLGMNLGGILCCLSFPAVVVGLFVGVAIGFVMGYVRVR